MKEERMAQIIKVYTQQAPASRFIGLRYGEQDRREGGFAHKWEEWFDQKRFQPLEQIIDASWSRAFPEAGSYIGLMRLDGAGSFEYWIGMFLPADSSVPPGYESIDTGEMRLGVCWVKGQEPDIYHQEEACLAALKAQGHTAARDGQGRMLVMERYQCPRSTRADEAGLRVLDLVITLLREDDGPANRYHCAACYRAHADRFCPDCGAKGSPLRADDPIFLGELPGRLRNAMQIAFAAGEIPFNALATLGRGFTLSAGDIFETYKIYVPYERLDDARAAFASVFDINDDT
jgi:hypothetical protein